MPAKAEKHDVVIIKCIVSFGEIVMCERTSTFSVCYGHEVGVPKIVSVGVLGMQCNESRSFAVTASTISSDELPYFSLHSIPTLEYICAATVLSLTKIKEFWNLSEKEKIENAQVLELRGNSLLQKEEFTNALSAYKLGIRTLKGSVSVDAPPSPHSSPVARTCLTAILTNAALCLLKLQQKKNGQNSEKTDSYPFNKTMYMKPCISVCRTALELDPLNVKAWYRKGQALAIMGDFSEAVKAGEAALNLLDDRSEARGRAELLAALQKWRSTESRQKRALHMQVHKAFLQRAAAIQSGRIQYDDDDYEREPIKVSQWSNSLADNMMSIHEELEAFGETMPEAVNSSTARHAFKNLAARGKSRLAPVDDFNEEDDYSD